MWQRHAIAYCFGKISFPFGGGFAHSEVCAISYTQLIHLIGISLWRQRIHWCIHKYMSEWSLYSNRNCSESYSIAKRGNEIRICGDHWPLASFNSNVPESRNFRCNPLNRSQCEKQPITSDCSVKWQREKGKRERVAAVRWSFNEYRILWTTINGSFLIVWVTTIDFNNNK